MSGHQTPQSSMQRLFPYNGSLDNIGDIMEGAAITSIAYRLLNGEKLNITKAGNYTIINYDNDYLIIDTATGIVRDVNIFKNVMGAYCFSHLQTEWAANLAKELLNETGLWKFIGFAGVSGAEVVGFEGGAEVAILEAGALSAPATAGIGIVVAIVAYILIEHPEWLPYIEDAMMLLSPAGLPTFIAYTLLTGDTQPIQNYLEILSRQSDEWSQAINEYREAVDTLRVISSGGVGGDPDDIGRAINNLGKLMMDEWDLFKEALKDGDVVGAIKHGGTIIGTGMAIGSLLAYENREAIEACILGFKNYLEKKLREAGG
ncbi:hypothetical protein FVF72_07965 [Methanothermobacter sp. KEPCO-1]|uniref:Uncharacterized protein n=2 Tax=Methanobacteriaceae TaxID=2159 RepID=D9PWV9_METTM|nr:conserved hypothetical protein [Methanothermobacter marburgensis str. Marburg]QEF95087.1 hypothetical protein FVF72_07965 [Methanothermobacter sp. KEPCO-1]QHN07477.1 hypothetical protein FZP68_01030 [Methanothermobacter sp. THM-2]WBF09276.1 hypothetical protein ISG34_05465 [Methanothermobacter marburgensis]